MAYKSTFPPFDVENLKKEVFESSEILKEIENIKKELVKESEYRTLSSEEIESLKKNGCAAEDWKNVKVKGDFNANKIVSVYFLGKVYLGEFKESVSYKGIELGSGIYNATLKDVVVKNNVLIKNVGLIANYVIKEKACILNVNTLTTKKSSTFGNGVELPIAIETGGREVLTYAEINVGVAAAVASNRQEKEFIAAYNKFVEEYCEKVKSDYGVICEGAIIANTSEIDSVFVGAYGIIDNAGYIKNATILSNEEEKTEVSNGAYVTDSIIQWGAEATSMGIVSESVMVEHSHVERHGKLTQSLLGPNSGIAEGECTASLCGPFVGFHHQSLLIAAFWPEGKGNVGYGANVGSNHTAKAPDQELWAGEGTFFGLGVNIKFPSNFTKAPYSIIATGVSALPQKVEFPFSLINTPAKLYEGISPAYNEIMPAWVLSDNIFTIRRNEGKYIKRNKAKREKFVFEVFRPDIIDLMIEARNRLKNINEEKEVYTEKDIPGLGKNYLTERFRKKGIEAYTFYLKFYALKGLYKKVEEYLNTGKKEKIANILEEKTDDIRWEHERKVFLEEFGNMKVKDALKLYKDMFKQIAEAVETAKAKDDRRGVRIIPDYAYAHTPAKENSFVKQTWTEYEEAAKKIDEIINKL